MWNTGTGVFRIMTANNEAIQFGAPGTKEFANNLLPFEDVHPLGALQEVQSGLAVSLAWHDSRDE